MKSKKVNLKIKLQHNSVAIVGWHDGGAGRIHSWLEETSGYYISCFINPSDKPLDIDPQKIKRDVSKFSYPTRDSFKNKPLLNISQWADFLIDVGINSVEDSSKRSGYRLDGDVDFEEVSRKSMAITPVPGGVGPMTIAMLLENVLKSYLEEVRFFRLHP